ncbi:MAG: hypothetical protein WDK96_02445 [Candidatus Paceibacterota bacterium]|jgi:hypothetical protein
MKKLIVNWKKVVNYLQLLIASLIGSAILVGLISGLIHKFDRNDIIAEMIEMTGVIFVLFICFFSCQGSKILRTKTNKEKCKRYS